MFGIEKITKNGQNHRKTKEKRAILPKCPFKRHARFKTGDFGTLLFIIQIIILILIIITQSNPNPKPCLQEAASEQERVWCP